MAPRGPPRTPRGPGPAAGAPRPEAPPPLPRSPRSRPLLLLLLLLPLPPAACGAAGRSPEPGRRGPPVQLTRSPSGPLAGRALPGGGEDGPERGDPRPAPGPGEDRAPAAGQGRWVRAAPGTGATSRAQVSLTSSSFVLKGDATHNQAMVHWTGENSSVILILTKYYHADAEKVLESSLWRSSDFGTTYTKLAIQPGFTTVIDSFFICPANKRKILFLSSSLSSGEQNLFLSTDEATTFRKQLVPFTVDKLIFHPKDEDKVLAYTTEGQLYASCDLGRKWLLLHEQVTKDHVFWAESGVGAGPDLVHMEVHDPAGGIRFVTAHVRNCSSRTLSSLFAGPIDHRSLLLQDEYIFFKATSSNQTRYYVSYRHNEFALMRLPKYALPKDLQVISTDESQVLVAVQEWYQTDTYNLYQSDPRGVFYSLVLEDVRSSRQAEEGVIVDVLEVHGVKGVFLANQKVNGKVMTLITYNKGRDWDPLRPPSEDMNGKPTSCQPPDCHLHLHLLWADNPYVSGTVHTKETAPGLIMGAGNLGSQLVEYKEEMYITSDCGRTWRQVFEEEHHILYLDHGGVIVAVKDSSIPLKILKFSTDEGLTWSTYNFTDTSVFVDGLLSEPGEETLVITIFGHISYRSEWELVKVDFRPSFPRPCRAEDYSAWDLTNLQGDGCLMGQRRSFRKRKATSWCVNGRNFTSALTAQVCPCQDSDFLCDYGFERSLSDTNKCFANFWFNPLAPPDDCVQGQTYTSSLGYRKVVANLCQGGVDPSRNPAPLPCPLTPPRGLRVSIIGESVAVRPGDDVLFEVRQEQGDVLTTKYQVDLGDGSTPVPVNLTLRRERVRHRYESPGVYRVSVRAENMAGRDEAVVFVQVNPPLQALYLEVVPVVGINEEVNLTAVLLPLNPNLTVFYWWIGLSLQPLLSLNNAVATRFVDPGDVRVTVQAACGSSVLQASKVVRVLDQFQVVPLQFSQNLDTYNPNTPEWREDVGQVVSWLLAKETGIPAELLVTVIEPGLPTVANLYVLPPPPGPSRTRSVSGDQSLAAVQQALSAQKISFPLRAGVRVLVALGPDTRSRRPGGSGGYWVVALLLVIGLFPVGGLMLYKFKRKRPDRTVYAQMHNAKEQEMTSPLGHSQGVPGSVQREDFIDGDLHSQTLGNHSGVVLSINSREMHSYLVS
ncbi:VPS10 domain-containing receptor SorCS2 [Myotis daubentonii]|uniref:VPS10 domain-containing receptor SorCS2 n=1 Tax=Myotis daubentonii TaxID=98922 RepID=UPI002872E67E|nr:VPS10 domain-containing receptor SorCS2 [Myotis daubentonii]